MGELITPDVLTRKMETTNIGVHRYLEKKNDHSLFCFMEGKHDPDYYLGIIRSVCGDDCITIVCGCKNNVIDAFNRVYAKDHTRYRLAFFVDRDFDETLGNPAIYETECYSIENNYCSESAFKRIMRYGLNISEEEPYWQTVMDFRNDQFEKFHKTVELFNAFYSLLHKYEREKSVIFQLNLEACFPNELAETDIQGCNAHYTLADLLSLYGVPSDAMTQAEVDAEIVRLRGLNPFAVFRGKYELNFLYKLLTFLITEANTKHQTRIIQKKVSMSLNGKSFMADLSQWADIPDSLRVYLNNLPKLAA